MKISVTQNFETDLYELQVTAYGSTDPAGPRLFRSPPHPDIQFTHVTAEAAQKDADTLQRYLDAYAAKKKPSKAAVRKAGAFT